MFQLKAPTGLLYATEDWNSLQVWKMFIRFWQERNAAKQPKPPADEKPPRVMSSASHGQNESLDNALLALDWCHAGGIVHQDCIRVVKNATPYDVYTACKAVVHLQKHTRGNEPTTYLGHYMHEGMLLGRPEDIVSEPFNTFLNTVANDPLDAYAYVIPVIGGYAFLVTPRPHEAFEGYPDLGNGHVGSVLVAALYTDDQRGVRRILQEDNPVYKEVLVLLKAI